MDLQSYLNDPCRASSLPYRKAKSVSVPQNMRIVHDSEFIAADWTRWNDESYFRLIHHLDAIATAEEEFTPATPEEVSAHIAVCYGDLRASPAQLAVDESLRIAIRRDGRIIASGVAELDTETGEGTLEWIQTSPDCRGQGLGKAIVGELLHRLGKHARFVTVSGRCNNPTNPERLYRSCGFVGNDI